MYMYVYVADGIAAAQQSACALALLAVWCHVYAYVRIDMPDSAAYSTVQLCAQQWLVLVQCCACT